MTTMKPEDCYLIVYNDDKILLAKRFLEFQSKYDSSSSFYGIKSSKAGIHLPKNSKYFLIIHCLPEKAKSPNGIVQNGTILVSDSMPGTQTSKRYYVNELNRSLNIKQNIKFFTTTFGRKQKQKKA